MSGDDGRGPLPPRRIPPLFDRLDAPTREALESLGKPRTVLSGATLFAEGSSGTEVFVIRRGRLKVVAVTPGGSEAMLAVRGPGDLVGEFSALDHSPRSASLVALEDISVLVVPVDRFRRFLRDYPTAMAVVLETVVGRLRESDRYRVEYAGYDSRTRLGLLLVSLAREHGTVVPASGGRRTIGLPLSQTDLAGAIGASREAVARALAAYRELGVVATGRRRVVVLDLAGLIADVTRRTEGPPGR